MVRRPPGLLMICVQEAYQVRAAATAWLIHSRIAHLGHRLLYDVLVVGHKAHHVAYALGRKELALPLVMELQFVEGLPQDILIVSAFGTCLQGFYQLSSHLRKKQPLPFQISLHDFQVVFFALLKMLFVYGVAQGRRHSIQEVIEHIPQVEAPASILQQLDEFLLMVPGISRCPCRSLFPHGYFSSFSSLAASAAAARRASFFSFR